MQTREDIEADIEDCKEEIYAHRHVLRWHIWRIRVFWLGIVIAAITLIILVPLNIPVVQSVLEGIGTGSIVLSIAAGIAMLVVFGIESESRDTPIADSREGLREAKRKLGKLYRQLAYYDEQSLKHLTAEQYMHQLPGLIASYRKRADRYRNWFVTTQLITIFLSAGITSLSGGWLDRYFSIPWIIPVIGALISILTSLTLFFKFREKGTNLQQTADAMDWEHMACTLGIDRYKGLPKDAAQVLLAEQAESLRKEQQKKQLQLEQSSHAEQKALQSST